MIGEGAVGMDVQQPRGIALGRGLLRDQLGGKVERYSRTVRTRRRTLARLQPRAAPSVC